jgi:DNA-binding transcriptional MocR family regulator
MAKRNGERRDRYFQVHHYMLKTEAWAALSAAARAIYLQIGFRYNGTNNGRIAYSVRDAARECNVAINTASRAFKELIDLGFIEETRHGSLSRKTRIASEWRLTAFRCDLTGALKTSQFMHRGAQARDNRQSRSRRESSPRLSQTAISRAKEAVSNEIRDCLKTANSLS